MTDWWKEYQTGSAADGRSKDSDLYFAQSKQNPYLVKIGVAGRVGERMSTLGTRVIAVIPGGAEREHDLHEKFADFRVGGEWFLPGEDLMSYIESLST